MSMSLFDTGLSRLTSFDCTVDLNVVLPYPVGLVMILFVGEAGGLKFDYAAVVAGYGTWNEVLKGGLNGPDLWLISNCLLLTNSWRSLGDFTNLDAKLLK